MAVIIREDFENFDSSLYTVVFGSAATINSTAAKRGSNGMYINYPSSGSQGDFIYRPFITTNSIFACRMSIRIEQALPSSSQTFFELQNSTNNKSFFMRMTTTTLDIAFFDLLSSASIQNFTFSTATWYDIDMKVDFSTTTWKADWKVNGTNQTQATRTSANTTAGFIPDRLRFGVGDSVARTKVVKIDDVWMTDNGSSYPMAYPGVFLKPISDITVGDYVPTPSSPSTLYDKLDESSATNLDADYISGTNTTEVKFG